MGSDAPRLSLVELEEARALGLFGFPIPVEILRAEPGAPRSYTLHLDAGIARRLLSRRLVLAEKVAAANPAVAGHRLDIADTQFRLGGTALTLGDRAGAESHFADCLARAEEEARLDPDDMVAVRYIVAGLVGLSDVAAGRGRRSEACELLARVEALLAPIAARSGSSALDHALDVIRQAMSSLNRRDPPRREAEPPGWAEPKPDDAETFSGLFEALFGG